MLTRYKVASLLGLTILLGSAAPWAFAGNAAGDDGWTAEFLVDPADLVSVGRNPFFILEPGYQLYYEDGDETLTITVLDETLVVDGVETRVVEERETEDGQLKEISRNYFAISTRDNSVYYFGEEVDIYRNGQIINHEGAWLSGQNDSRFGLIMPGQPLEGARHYQEIAPKVALDRAEIVGTGLTFKTPAGTFDNCIKVEETTPLHRRERSIKHYAPGVGLIQDASLLLVRHGMVE